MKIRSAKMIEHLSKKCNRVNLYLTIIVLILFSTWNYHIFFYNFILHSPNYDHSGDKNETILLGLNIKSPTTFNNTNSNTIKKETRDHQWRIEAGLAKARTAIINATRTQRYKSYKDESFIPRGPAYINPYAFHQSHIEMERRFKVWAYKEGDLPIFHKGPMNEIYSTEGSFINELERESSPFLARNPEEAQAFFIPVSIVSIIQYVYKPYTNCSRERLQNIVKDYITLVSNKYPHWNRSSGADHFLVSCHDWAPDVSRCHPDLYKNFIRVLCNANSSEGFKPNRDVSLPEIKLPRGASGFPLDYAKVAKPPQNRSILAFFAGGRHGEVREELFKHWKHRNDKDVVVHEYLPKTLNYNEMIGKSKFCLCPSGYEVASPRVVEAIYGGCVPVIISTSYVLPFSDVLNWSKFSVHIPVERIPEIKEILKGISEEKYLEMQKIAVSVQRHFVVNRPPLPFDFMYMVMHSIWLRRLNVRVRRVLNI